MLNSPAPTGAWGSAEDLRGCEEDRRVAAASNTCENLRLHPSNKSDAPLEQLLFGSETHRPADEEKVNLAHNFQRCRTHGPFAVGER